MLKGRHGTLNSSVWYSKVSVFSFVVVLLSFLKNLRSFLFPKIVVSALIGSVLYLFHDLSCLMTRSRFRHFRNNSRVIVSVVGKKMFSTCIFDMGIVLSGSYRLKTWFVVYFESFGNGPDKFIVSVRFSFSFKGNGSFLCGSCLISFCWVLILIQCEHGIGLNVDVLSKST